MALIDELQRKVDDLAAAVKRIEQQSSAVIGPDGNLYYWCMDQGAPSLYRCNLHDVVHDQVMCVSEEETETARLEESRSDWADMRLKEVPPSGPLAQPGETACDERIP